MNLETSTTRPGEGVGIAVLAAGHGKRMRSQGPKHLMPVGGVPIVERVIRAGLGVEPDKLVTIVSPVMADLPERLDIDGQFEAVVQPVPEGTAAAVRLALEHLPDCEWVVSLLGDNPLLTSSTIQKLIDTARTHRYKATLLTAWVEDAASYGRIERDGHLRPTRIVEFKNDDPELRKGSTEINSGIMVLDAEWARGFLSNLQRDATTKEFMLTDLIELAVSQRQDGEPWPVGAHVGEPQGAVGVNDRSQQAEADAIVREQVRKRLMADGVTLIGAETIFVDESVTVGPDTTIMPFSVITGRTVIGSGCTIGPHALIENSRLADRVVVQSSTVRESSIASDSDVGPYAHLRQNVRLGERVHIGTSAELKNTVMGDDSRSGHFSYLGDATIGEDVNIGAGTITANFDGRDKHPTTIGDHAFVGSDSVLVAPVVIGAEARTGAGSVVTKDVASGKTVVGVPARPIGDRRAGQSGGVN